MSDEFGNRMKMYEKAESGRRFMPLLPIYARIDGRSFSKFTKGMNRPYDIDLSNTMIETTKYLVQETNAKIGYTQSDEISLVWYSDSVDSQVFFDGKITKMTSVLAAMATAKFTNVARGYWPVKVDNSLPVFDARVFTLPNKMEATNALLWREQDATKNAVSMAARAYFSHKELHGQGRSDMQEMMWQQHQVNFNDYPAFFKRGTFVRRIVQDVMLSDEELAKIPEGRRPDGPVTRSFIVPIDMPRFGSVTNRVDVVFESAEPIVEGEIK